MNTTLPQGYTGRDYGSLRVVATRQQIQEMADLLTGDVRSRGEGDQVWGRGSTKRVTLSGGTNVFVRQYLRGGVARFFIKDLYLLRPPRPLHELIVTEAARAAGCPVPTVAAICVEDVGPFYRGWIVTEAIEGATPFIECYRDADTQTKRVLLGEAGRAIRSIHDAGVYHVDLTGDNLLVDKHGTVSIIDFDKALLRAETNPRLRRRGMDRFWRSMRKLSELCAVPVADDDRSWLEQGYER